MAVKTFNLLVLTHLVQRKNKITFHFFFRKLNQKLFLSWLTEFVVKKGGILPFVGFQMQNIVWLLGTWQLNIHLQSFPLHLTRF